MKHWLVKEISRTIVYNPNEALTGQKNTKNHSIQTHQSKQGNVKTHSWAGAVNEAG